MEYICPVCDATSELQLNMATWGSEELDLTIWRCDECGVLFDPNV